MKFVELQKRAIEQLADYSDTIIKATELVIEELRESRKDWSRDKRFK